MKKTLCRGLIACVSLVALASCQDYEGGFDLDTIKKASYAKDFEKTFGTVDPNQDWSMASTITATVNLGDDVVVSVYSENPSSPNAKVLAVINGSTATFNGIKGNSQVYAMAFKDDKVVAKGYYDIKDNTVAISNQSAPQTRTSGTVSVVGDAATLTFDSPDMVWNTTNGFGSSFVDFIENYNGASSSQLCTEEDLSLPEWTLKNNSYLLTYGTSRYWVYSWHFVKSQKSIVLKNLSGVPTSPVTGLTLGEFYDMFGPGTFFEEYKSYHNSPKYPEMYKSGDLEKLERGVEIITDGGEINVPFIYGATQNYTKFGYVYFKDGEDDPFSKPHYILIDNTHPDENITFSNGAFVGEMQLAGWNKNGDDPRNNQPLESTGVKGNEQMIGTNYTLYFFGDEENSAGFSFPAGYRIVFFMAKQYSKDGAFDSGYFNYSLRDYNRRISHGYAYKNADNYTFPGCDGNHDGWNTDPCTGVVKAGAWKYGDKLLLGFEDGTDDDLNDLLFWINGSFHTDEEIIEPIPTPDPDPDPVPETETIETETSWIYACEDLGGTFDYDFNDVVWAVVNKYEITRYKDTKEPVGSPVFKSSCIRLLACGGTLPVQLIFDGKVVGGKEIHQQFGQPEANGYSANVSPSPVEIALSTTSAIVIDDTFNQKFTLKVENKNASSTYVTTPTRNENAAPQVLVLTGDWEWPKEGMPIDEAYKEFTNWTKDVTWNTWASKKTENSTVPRAH